MLLHCVGCFFLARATAATVFVPVDRTRKYNTFGFLACTAPKKKGDFLVVAVPSKKRGCDNQACVRHVFVGGGGARCWSPFLPICFLLRYFGGVKHALEGARAQVGVVCERRTD
nr:hypothetical protein [Pandoravirus massiliensis]